MIATNRKEAVAIPAFYIICVIVIAGGIILAAPHYQEIGDTILEAWNAAKDAITKSD